MGDFRVSMLIAGDASPLCPHLVEAVINVTSVDEGSLQCQTLTTAGSSSSTL